MPGKLVSGVQELVAAETGRLAERISTVGEDAGERADDVAWRLAKLSDRAAERLGDYAATTSQRVANRLVRLAERLTER